MTFADVILQQLGGPMFLAMTGAKQLLRDENARALTMRVGKNDKDVTHVRITLTPADLYNVEFIHCRGTMAPRTISTADNVYAESLRVAFTRGTGLDTSL